MDEAAVVDIVLQIGVGGVHRTRDGAGPAFSRRSISATHLPDKTLRFVRRISPAAPRHLLLVQPLAHVRRDGDVHHLRIGQAKARHQRGVILDAVHLKFKLKYEGAKRTRFRPNDRLIAFLDAL